MKTQTRKQNIVCSFSLMFVNGAHPGMHGDGESTPRVRFHPQIPSDGLPSLSSGGLEELKEWSWGRRRGDLGMENGEKGWKEGGA